MSISSRLNQLYRNAGFTEKQIGIIGGIQSQVLPVGTTAGTVAAGDDVRFSASNTPSWVFNVKDYGAKGDGQVVSDAAMLNGSSTVTFATSTKLVIGQDEGKHVFLRKPGNSALSFLGTILSVLNNHTAVLSFTNSSGGNYTGCTFIWATDDTAAIQDAIDDATNFCRGMAPFAGPNFGGAEIFSPAGVYGIAGALRTGGSYLGNSQLCLLPIPDTENAVCLDFTGIVDASATQHWNAKVPQFSGTTWFSFGLFSSPSAQTTSENANGHPSVLGGPTYTNGYGVAPGVFSNMQVTISKMTLMTSYSHDGISYGAANFFGIAKAGLRDMSWGGCGVVLNGSGDFTGGASYGSGDSVGIVMPAPGNNDKCFISNVTCHGGYTYAMFFGEHTVADRVCILYCFGAICLVGAFAGSVGATHAFYIAQASVEQCVNLMMFVGAGSGGVGPIFDVAQLDTETSAPAFASHFSSPAAMAAAVGRVKLTGLYNWGNLSAPGATFTIVNGQVN